MDGSSVSHESPMDVPPIQTPIIDLTLDSDQEDRIQKSNEPEDSEPASAAVDIQLRASIPAAPWSLNDTETLLRAKSIGISGAELQHLLETPRSDSALRSRIRDLKLFGIQAPFNATSDELSRIAHIQQMLTGLTDHELSTFGNWSFDDTKNMLQAKINGVQNEAIIGILKTPRSVKDVQRRMVQLRANGFKAPVGASADEKARYAEVEKLIDQIGDPKWSLEDIELLLRAKVNGADSEQISTTILMSQRSVGAIDTKVRELKATGIKPRSGADFEQVLRFAELQGLIDQLNAPPTESLLANPQQRMPGDRRRRVKAPTTRGPYTPEEDRVIVQLFAEHRLLSTVAGAIGRSKANVLARWNKMHESGKQAEILDDIRREQAATTAQAAPVAPPLPPPPPPNAANDI